MIAELTAQATPAGLLVSGRWTSQSRAASLTCPLSVYLGAWRWARKAKDNDSSVKGCVWRTLQVLANRGARGVRWITEPETAQERLNTDLGSAGMFAAELERRRTED